MRDRAKDDSTGRRLCKVTLGRALKKMSGERVRKRGKYWNKVKQCHPGEVGGSFQRRGKVRDREVKLVAGGCANSGKEISDPVKFDYQLFSSWTRRQRNYPHRKKACSEDRSIVFRVTYTENGVIGVLVEEQLLSSCGGFSPPRELKSA